MTLTTAERMATHLTDQAFAKWARADRTVSTSLTPTALYRFFDAADDLLYVGITKSPVARLHEHSRRAWCRQAVRVTLEWYPSETAARTAEDEAIRVEDPRHNIAGKVR